MHPFLYHCMWRQLRPWKCSATQPGSSILGAARQPPLGAPTLLVLQNHKMHRQQTRDPDGCTHHNWLANLNYQGLELKKPSWSAKVWKKIRLQWKNGTGLVLVFARNLRASSDHELCTSSMCKFVTQGLGSHKSWRSSCCNAAFLLFSKHAARFHVSLCFKRSLCWLLCELADNNSHTSVCISAAKLCLG